METYPEQFPDEGHPDPGHRAEDPVFDPIQDGDHPGSTNQEGHPDPEAPEMDFNPMVIGRGPLRPAGQGYPVAPE